MNKIWVLILVSLVVINILGCSKKSEPEKNVSVNDVRDKVVAQIKKDLLDTGSFQESDFTENEIPGYLMNDITDEAIGDFILPLKELPTEELEGGFVIQAMMNINSDLIIVAKAKSDEGAEKIKRIYDVIWSDQDKLWGQYLPDQHEKVKGNVLKVEGPFVYYIVYSDAVALDTVVQNAIQGK